MRVRDRSPVRIGEVGQWITVSGETDKQRGGRGAALKGPLEIDMADRGWSIVDGQGFRAAVGEHETIDLSLLVDETDPIFTVITGESANATRKYRGTLRLVSRHDLDEVDTNSRRTTPSRAFDLINDVPIESYLPGVLAGELYPQWHPETFAAQAIAARSFACNEAAVFAGRRHYDVGNTANSQMYLGVVGQDRDHQAVAATRGKLLAYENLLVSGYYSSCCGGLAASATDAIGSNPVNDVAPLRGRPGSDVCTEAPVYQWRIEQPLDQLQRRLAGFARERSLKTLEALQRLASIDISATNANGRPTRMLLTDDRQQTAELSAEDFRRAANYASDDAAGARGVRGARGSAGVIMPPEKELRSSNLRASITGSTVIFDGNGFGHGVGLCQHGAETLARSGTAHEDIVRWYYPGVEIVAAYV
jgi:stage II sporulation protein D